MGAYWFMCDGVWENATHYYTNTPLFVSQVYPELTLTSKTDYRIQITDYHHLRYNVPNLYRNRVL